MINALANCVANKRAWLGNKKKGAWPLLLIVPISKESVFASATVAPFN